MNLKEKGDVQHQTAVAFSVFVYTIQIQSSNSTSVYRRNRSECDHLVHFPCYRKKQNGHQSPPANCHVDKTCDVPRAQRRTLRIVITVYRAISIALNGQETHYRNDPLKYDLAETGPANKLIEPKL